MSQYSYFLKPTITSTSFSANYFYFGFVSSGMVFSIESGTSVQYSFDGVSVDGDLTTGQYSAGLNFPNRYVSGVYFRSTGSSANIRIEAWAVA